MLTVLALWQRQLAIVGTVCRTTWLAAAFDRTEQSGINDGEREAPACAALDGEAGKACQCRLLRISRSGLCNKPKGISEEELILMGLIDRQYLATPFYRTRKMAA